MKRSGLTRRTGLARRAPLRRVVGLARGRRRPLEPGQAQYKALCWGRCQACGAQGLLRRHHVVLEQHARRLGADPWDPRNAMLVGLEGTCACHSAHHQGRRISVRRVPDEAIRFTVELLGARTGAYLSRYYSP